MYRLRTAWLRLINSPFTQNVVVVGGGIAAAQAITLAFTPFITRLYGPEAFGVFAIFTAITSIITPTATLGYSNAIVMPKDDIDAGALIQLSILCGLLLTPVSMMALYLTAPWLAKSIGLESIPAALYLLPVAILLTALLSVTNNIAVRQGRFKAKARAYVESKLFSNISKLVTGFFSPSGFSLIFIALAEQFINIILQISSLGRINKIFYQRWIGISRLFFFAKKYKDFSIFRMPQGVIKSVSMGMPIIFLTNFYGSGSAGQYSLVVLILGAPAMLLGESVREVFYPKITQEIRLNTKKAKEKIYNAVFLLIIIGILPFGFLAAFGEVLIPWLAGDEWRRAGEYSKWLAISMIFMMAVEPAISAMPELKVQSILLLYEIIIAIIRGAAIYIGFKLGDDLDSIAFFSIANTVGYIFLISFVLIRVGKHRHELINFN